LRELAGGRAGARRSVDEAGVGKRVMKRVWETEERRGLVKRESESGRLASLALVVEREGVGRRRR